MLTDALSLQDRQPSVPQLVHRSLHCSTHWPFEAIKPELHEQFPEVFKDALDIQLVHAEVLLQELHSAGQVITDKIQDPLERIEPAGQLIHEEDENPSQFLQVG
jgi:hypothetical protein